jgi:hypothetical protein
VSKKDRKNKFSSHPIAIKWMKQCNKNADESLSTGFLRVDQELTAMEARGCSCGSCRAVCALGGSGFVVGMKG